MKIIQVQDALTPAGHYSPATVSNGLVFVSGILPIDMFTGEKFAEASLDQQTELALANLERILIAAGSDLKRVVRTTIYLSDGAYWVPVNAIYARVFGSHRPARTMVPTGPLHYGVKIELDAVAEVVSEP
ncbi:MAG: RidA family protein [Bacteroidetes bacterium]|nr:RidA family protein [Fibrella sp.]